MIVLLACSAFFSGSETAFFSLSPRGTLLLRRLQNTLVTNAMEVLQAKNEKIALVVRVAHKNYEIPVGIITMKDLIEELFGELGSW